MEIALFYPVVYHQMFLYSLSESCHISVCSPILGQTQRPSIGTSAGNCAVAALCDVFCLPAHSGQQRHVRAPKPSGLKPYGWWWCLRIPCTFQGYAGNIYHIYPEKSWTLNKLNKCKGHIVLYMDHLRWLFCLIVWGFNSLGSWEAHGPTDVEGSKRLLPPSCRGTLTVSTIWMLGRDFGWV